uniref:Uncharacterized protein n=1 Tax=Oryza sativa subsp. japonica TaxID=39947 RepID=Q69PS0_ORYSJ|nr:hypothetical protein [Oryza sativa Japonica Group]BAD33520.1 hypothetical protein [Oryza sativa Japonica Group]
MRRAAAGCGGGGEACRPHPSATARLCPRRPQRSPPPPATIPPPQAPSAPPPFVPCVPLPLRHGRRRRRQRSSVVLIVVLHSSVTFLVRVTLIPAVTDSASPAAPAATLSPACRRRCHRRLCSVPQLPPEPDQEVQAAVLVSVVVLLLPCVVFVLFATVPAFQVTGQDVVKHYLRQASEPTGLT